MPRYRTRDAKKPAKPAKRGTRKYAKKISRDPVKLLRWAAKGTLRDYGRLAALAKKMRHSVPAFIDGVAFDKITHVDRLSMIEEIQAAEQHDISAGGFLDAVSWLLDKVPWGNWVWPVAAAQSTVNAQKGDGLNEVDEQYARLVGATYGDVENRPYVIDHWKRQAQFDGSFISVWDNPDGHRLIAVRGTEGATDIGQDLLVGLTGRSTNLIGDELLQILAATPKDVVVDLAAHSLGVSLALQAYVESDLTYKHVHETYLYNPAWSPIMRGSVDHFERDTNVRYFINMNDMVSMGGLGHRAPSNVVYRSTGLAGGAHGIAQWQGSSAYQAPIYHSPPETRVQAHKAAMWLTPKDKGLVLPADADPDFIIPPEELFAHTRIDESGAQHWKESNAAAAPVQMGHAAAGGRTFDFGGDQPDFDFDGL